MVSRKTTVTCIITEIQPQDGKNFVLFNPEISHWCDAVLAICTAPIAGFVRPSGAQNPLSVSKLEADAV